MSRRGSAPRGGSSLRGGGAGRPGGAPRASNAIAVGHSAYKDPSGRTSEYSSPDDRCPECKTDRYLNPRLRLLVSPCYHKMCESCIDRIFSLGPMPCPRCGQMVRKNQFSAQTFQDLGVEKEVAVRRRVARLFNKREEDFEDLKAYNDYLEEVEEITFNLINDVDAESTNAKIQAYEAANRQAILSNAQASAAESEALRAQEEAEKAERRARGERLRDEEERERVARDRDRVEAMRELERTNGNAEEVAERFRQRALQREALRTASPGPVTMPGAGAGGKGAAANRKGESARPWSLDQLLDFEGPLASLSDARELFDVRPVPANLGGLGGNGAIGYEDPWIKAMDKDEQARLRAGGYDFAQVWGRAIRVAVEGLGVPPLTGNQHGALYGAPAEGAQAMEVGA